jgi:signal transduction histidine kinase
MAKILIIEDDPVINQGVSEWLTFEGYTVAVATNGHEGVKLALQELPDLIVSDIRLPGQDGYRVLLELRKHPQTALIPFIFMSAMSERENIRYGMELGADDYLTKPFSNKELLGLIRSRLEKQEVSRQQARVEMDNLRSDILRHLPHELRTPLIGILGLSEILEIDVAVLTEEEISQIARDIASSGRRLLRLTENFILYTQLEVRHSLRPATVPYPDKVIEQVCLNLQSDYKRVGDLEWNCSRGSPAIDEAHFKKIVYELVDNALKFSLPGARVEINGPVEKGHYRITVKDRGEGFNLKSGEELGAFTQFDRRRKEQQGSGLGLILVKKLVELYGGSFSIESQVGAGTTVQVEIPLAK